MAVYVRALEYTWLLLAAVGLCVVVLPFVVSPAALSAAIPACEARAHGGSCLLCGMTAAFFAISRGRFAEAHVLNAGALLLYAAFYCNAFLALFYGGKRCR